MRTLNEIMEFDHVVEVRENGTVSDGPPGVYAPDLWDGELQGDGWTLMSGYTGQQDGGDIMHESEFIGGGLERDILTNPGLYVALVAYYTPEDEDNENNVGGWAVAWRAMA
jgi:hypothetical protein